MARVKKGDLVVVRSGADAGKRGKVLRVLPDESGGGRAIVEGVRMLFKHMKRSQKHPQGGRIQREGAIPLSILMPVDPTTDKPTRVAYREVDGEKVRVSRSSGARLEGEKRARAERKPAEKSAQETKS